MTHSLNHASRGAIYGLLLFVLCLFVLPVQAKRTSVFSSSQDKQVEMKIDSLNQLGDLYYKGKGIQKDYQKAFDYFSQSNALGSSYAKYKLGLMYYFGDGVEADTTQANQYYTEALPELLKLADKGDDEAQWTLGEMYQYGNGVFRNIATGMDWYEISAGQGDAEKQFKLG